MRLKKKKKKKKELNAKLKTCIQTPPKIRCFIKDIGLSIHQLLFASNFHINIHTLTKKTNALKECPQ